MWGSADDRLPTGGAGLRKESILACVLRRPRSAKPTALRPGGSNVQNVAIESGANVYPSATALPHARAARPPREDPLGQAERFAQEAAPGVREAVAKT